MNRKQARKVNDVLDNFNFPRVKDTMDALKWDWADVGGVPSISTLRLAARKLLRQVITWNENNNGYKTDDDVTIGTGGFEATYDYKHKSLTLKFVVADWESD